MGKVKQPAEAELIDYSNDGFLREADCLAQTAMAPGFKQLLRYFGSYSEFLTYARREYFGEDFFEETTTATHLDFETPSEGLSKLKQAINLAAACDLFNGWSLPVNGLHSHILRDQVKDAIKDMGKSRRQAAEILAAKLNSGDAARVIHMLKILGCIAPDMTTYPQLSLGASGGTRDRYAIHQMPSLRYQQSNPLLSNPVPEMVGFSTTQQKIGNVVLVDNDVELQGRYRKLNEEPNLLALNLDVIKALKDLKRRIDSHELAPRKFIVAFRIDHRMIPDVNNFFHYLAEVMDDTAELVITIGAGHSNQEFRGRLEKISEIGKLLTGRGLNPIQIKWYRGNTLNEQRSNPIFGMSTYATYEVLYCKLLKSCIVDR